VLTFKSSSVATSVRNPQANAICERLHQYVFLSQPIPANVLNVAELVDSAIATALHASRATIHRTLGMSPGGIIFNRDMFLNIPLLTDFELLQTRRQVIINDNLCRANSKRRQHDYQPGDECLILDHKATKKLDTRFIGPFTILHSHVNGTLTIPQRTPDVIDRVNIRQVKPYFRNG
jgi:hypothetical protein